MKSSVAELKIRYYHLILYLFILEPLILSITLILMKVLSHVYYILESHTKMLRPETENNPIHKIYLMEKFLILLIKNLGSFLRKTFSQC
jgi:hypothetical protein